MEYLIQHIWLLLFTIAAVSLTVYGMFYIMNKAIAFNVEYERVKLRIYNKENREEVFAEIKALSQLSIHHSMGDKVRVLFKSFELAYNVTVDVPNL